VSQRSHARMHNRQLSVEFFDAAVSCPQRDYDAYGGSVVGGTAQTDALRCVVIIHWLSLRFANVSGSVE